MNAPSKEQNRLGALALAATVVAGVGVLWWRFNAVPANPIMARLSDLVNYYVPMTELVMRRLGAGEIPLWNPHACAGIPLLATMQIGALYPGTWLALALPAHQALSLLMFVECALSGWFLALLLRSWGCDGFAAATGAILFVATCVLGQTFWPPHVSTILWLPWLLLCVEKLASRWSGRWALGLSAGVALQILAGAPQYLLYTLQLVVPVGLLRLLQARKTQSEAWADLAARGLGIATAAALGAGLAAAQLLPTLELTANSARETLSPASVHYLNIWDRHPSSDVLRNLLDPSAKLPTFEAGDGSGYLGIPLLIGFALGVFAGFRRPLVWLLLAIGALTLILSDGYFGWGARIYPLYASLPVVGAFRTPERLRLTTFLCVTIVAAFGFDQLSRAQEEKRRRFQLVALGASLAIAAGMIAFGRVFETWRVGAALALALTILQWPARTRLRRGAQALLLLLVLSDMTAAIARHGVLRAFPTRMTRHFQPGVGPPLREAFFARQRRQAGLDRLELYGFFPVMASEPSNGIYRLACYEPLIPRQWTALPRFLTDRASLRKFVLPPEDHPTVYDVASVRRTLVATATGAVEILENEDALPRAYLVERARLATQIQAFEHLKQASVDFERTVLLERDPGGEYSALFEGEGPGRPLQPAAIVHYAPERAVISARSRRPAVLVLTDTYYPGWRAYVDGEETEILRANGLFRAVRFPSGKHEVVFEFRPQSFRWGVVISLASLGVLIAAVAVNRFVPGRAKMNLVSRSLWRYLGSN